jgi:hypothetical protein
VDAGETDEARLVRALGDLDRLVQRLQRLSPAAWRSREAPVREALTEMASLDCRLAGVGPRRLPSDLPLHALADAVSVVGADLLTELRRDRDAALFDRTTDILADCERRTR